MNITKFVLFPLNSAYASESFRPTANQKFTWAQVKLTRAYDLVGLGVDTSLKAGDNQLHHSTITTRSALITAKMFSCE